MNILVNGDQVTAVLDWPGFMIDDAALDVAATMVLIQIVAGHLMPEVNRDEIMSRYLKAYTNRRQLDVQYLDYYRMLRCIPAIMEASTGQGAWSIEPILNELIATVKDISNIRITL